MTTVAYFFQHQLSYFPLQLVYKFNSYLDFGTSHTWKSLPEYQDFRVKRTNKNPTTPPQCQNLKKKQTIFPSIFLVIPGKVEGYAILNMTNKENYFEVCWV